MQFKVTCFKEPFNLLAFRYIECFLPNDAPFCALHAGCIL